MRYDPMISVLGALRGGHPVVVIDHNVDTAVLVLAASVCSTAELAFTIRHGSGYVRAALTPGECDRIHLPSLRRVGVDEDRPNFCVSVDAQEGTTTGISARDRALTIRLLASSTAMFDDFTRPGHVITERAAAGGVLSTPGFAESAIDLARLAGLGAAAAYSELTSLRDACHLADAVDAVAFARAHRLSVTSIADIVRHREQVDISVDCVQRTELTTRYGDFTAHRFVVGPTGEEMMCLTHGMDAGSHSVEIPVAVHAECVEARVFRGAGCSCDDDLADVMKQVAVAGLGAIVYSCRQNVTQQLTNATFVTSGTTESAHSRSARGREHLTSQIVNGFGPAFLVLQSLGVTSIRLMTTAQSRFPIPRPAVAMAGG